MKPQLVVAAAIVLTGGGVLGGEYYLSKWYPQHQRRVGEELLNPFPYRNDALGIEMKIAAGIYGKVDDFPGGVKIGRSIVLGGAPSLTITSQPNPERTFEFSPQILAKWQTLGAYENIPQYSFEHTKIMNRDAVLIGRLKGNAMDLTARVVTPDRIVEADCTPGGAEEALFLRACDESLRTLKVAGPEPPAAGPVDEIITLPKAVIRR